MDLFILSKISYFDCWLVSALILILFFIKFPTNFFSKYNTAILFLFLNLYLFLWIFSGFDITDEGYMLSKSWLMLHGMWTQNIDIIFGTTLFNGLWLSIIGKPFIIWERIGFILITSLNSVLVFIILKQYFNIIKSFIVVVVITMIFSSNVCQTINYNNFPVLIIISSILLLLKAQRTLKFSLLFFSGFIISLSFFARISFVSFVFLPIFLFCYQYVNNGRDFSVLKKQLFATYSGFFAGVFLGLILLLFTNSLHIYADKITSSFKLLSEVNVHRGHTQSQLINILKDDIWLISNKVILFIFLFLLIISLEFNRVSRYLKYLIFILFSYLLFIFSVEKGNSQSWIYVIISLGFTSILFYLFISDDDINKKYLIISSTFLLFFSFLGSNNGIRMTFDSGSAILFIASSFLFLDELTLNVFNKEKNFKPVLYIIGGFIFIFIYNRKPIDAYRDRPRIELNVPFSSEALMGISSHQLRVNAVDSLILNFNKIKDDNQTVLACGSIPMFYFITNTKPFISNPWFFNQDEFSSKVNANLFPDYIVMPKNDPRSINWPIFNEKSSNIDDSLTFHFLNNFIRQHQYESIYSNKMFDIFASVNSFYQIDSNNLLNYTIESPNDFSTYDSKSILSIDSSSLITKSKCSYKVTSLFDGSVYGIVKDNFLKSENYAFEAWVYFSSSNTICVQLGGSVSLFTQNIEPNKWTKIKFIKRASDSRLLIGVSSLPIGEYFLIDNISIYNVHKKTKL